MTEKRFTETISTMTVTDNVTGREYKCEMGIDTDLLDLLNAQHEENELLKKEYREMEIKVGKLKGEIGELFCENEQLKQENQFLKNALKLDEITKEITERTR